MIDPTFLDELARFDPSVQRRVDAVQQGEQRSTEVGEGLTFSDHRKYTPGDDTRLVDWRVYARTEELYIKQYEAERNLTVHVLVDASRSMDFGGDREARATPNKFEYAAKLGLGFAALAAAEQNDFRVSLLGETFERIDRGRSTQGEVLRLIEQLNKTEPSGETDFRTACADYAATIDSKSLVLVASDFLDDTAEIEAGLAALQRNDCTLAHVLSPDERDPPAQGDTIFRDPEADRRLRTYFGANVERRYRDRLQEHLDEVEAVGDRVGARHVAVDTGEDFFDTFGEVWVE
ncbi:DUF58 domain-containing protein [Halorientalis sp.]|uniref:DUF58 domain-containing protein n=1 Tax=Halorientalis sp. TaxID=1931229 RepID=UPI0026228722|nr:DUF58 domain-containing protein [Halorientalis sp.]